VYIFLQRKKVQKTFDSGQADEEDDLDHKVFDTEEADDTKDRRRSVPSWKQRRTPLSKHGKQNSMPPWGWETNARTFHGILVWCAEAQTGRQTTMECASLLIIGMMRWTHPSPCTRVSRRARRIGAKASQLVAVGMNHT